jgi:DNA-binding transcriptional regulator YdaS (Cro superfamily)
LTFLPSSEKGLRVCDTVPELSEVIADAKRLTAKRGQATKLAEKLEVSPSRVSEWFSGVSKPDGEAALALLAWVTEAKRQQKSRNAATNSITAAARRKANTSHANQTSGRRKKR